MQISCPSCSSTNIKKNGKTHYGKQNHKCKICGRQFVAGSKHRKTSEERELIKQSLKERLSLHAICRIFGVSMTWLQNFAQNEWKQTPRDLGISSSIVHRLGKLQVFRLQVDELWSFVRSKKRKRWIWVVYAPKYKLVIAQHIGGRGKRAALKLWKKVPDELKTSYFETDAHEAYKTIIPPQQHKVGKHLTYFIEGFNATIRARVSRLVRKSLSFSKKDIWHNLAIAWFFWQLNLERLQPYI